MTDALRKKAEAFFKARAWEVLEQELSAEFPDRDIRELRRHGIIAAAKRGAVFQWIAPITPTVG